MDVHPTKNGIHRYWSIATSVFEGPLLSRARYLDISGFVAQSSLKKLRSSLVSGIPSPLKNDGVKVSWADFPFPTEWKPPSRSIIYIIWVTPDTKSKSPSKSPQSGHIMSYSWICLRNHQKIKTLPNHQHQAAITCKADQDYQDWSRCFDELSKHDLDTFTKTWIINIRLGKL